METLHNFPFFSLEFDKNAQPVKPSQLTDLLTFLGQAPPVTDLLVLSHGWNNDMTEAHARYADLLAQLRAYAAPGRRYAAVGVFWPSKKFADQELIPGGAAAFGTSPGMQTLLLSQLDELHGSGAFDAPDADARLARARELVPLLDRQQSARTEFADLMKGLLAGVQAAPGDVDGATAFAQAPSATLVETLGKPLPVTLQGPVKPGATGAAAGIGQFFGGIKAGALNLLNVTTYYQMKERAGLVGAQALRPVLAQLARQFPQLRLHLVGHSFGGRLVTAAVSGQSDFRVQTLTLLQTAFSHFGFADNYDGQGGKGFFRALITDGRVTGPVLISHSVHDMAVGRAYPLASRLANQVAAFLGGPGDKFGGIGRNGAQKTPEASFELLQAAPGTYAFRAGHLHNLNGDGVIMGHGDITKPEIGSAIMQAIATT